MRPRYLVSALVSLAVLGGVLAIPAARAARASSGSTHAAAHGPWVGSGDKAMRVPDSSSPSPSASPTPSAKPPAPAPVEPKVQVTTPDADFFGWALLNRRSGTITGSDNRVGGTSSTESMIKVWIVSDYLRQLPAGTELDATTSTELAAAIVHSDDNAAEKYYRLGGGNAMVQRMISMCGLTDTTWYDGWWSRTEMSPQDAVRLGLCVADGTAAGAWTPWVLTQMRSVQGGVADQQETTGGGRWGIIDGVPATVAGALAIKNGWTAIGSDGDWHVNNLAISDDWVLAVMVRYPIAKGLQYGADVCATLARQVLTDPAP